MHRPSNIFHLQVCYDLGKPNNAVNFCKQLDACLSKVRVPTCLKGRSRHNKLTMESNQDWPPAKRRCLGEEQNTHAAALKSGNAHELQQPGERSTCHQSFDETDDQCEDPPSFEDLLSIVRGEPYEVAGSHLTKYQPEAPAELFQNPVRPVTIGYDASFSWQQMRYSTSTVNKNQTSPSRSPGIAQHLHKWQSPYASLPRLPHYHTSAQTIQTQDPFCVPAVSNQPFEYNQTESRLQYDKDPLAHTSFPGVGRKYTPEEHLASQVYELEAEGTAQQSEIVCFGMVR